MPDQSHHAQAGEVIVIGGANIDIKGRSHGGVIAATSNPGDVVTAVGGVGRNIAHNLALLGIDTALISFVGGDAYGERLRQETQSAGVDVSMLATGDQPTGVYLAILDHQGELVSAISDMRSAEALNPEHLWPCAKRLAKAAMIIADCNITVACLAWTVEFTRHHSVKLLIEPISVPKARKLLQLKNISAYAVTPNQSQLAALGGLEGLHRLGFANVIAHEGKAGVTISDGRAAQHIAALPVDGVSDVTGAGDAAVAGLVCGLALGHDLAQSARLGQAAAALKIISHSSVATAITRARMFALAGVAS